MDITTYDQREKQLELWEKLIIIEELRRVGVQDLPAREASQSLRERLRAQTNA